MAQFDLKNALIYIQDGYSTDPGAVNNAAGYAQGHAASMLVDGFTASLTVGDTVTFASHATRYTITAKTDTLGVTTAITVTPALTAAVADDEVITAHPHRVEVGIGEGNLTWTEKKPREYKKNRGRLDTVKDADEEPIDVRLDFEWEFIRADTGEAPTIEDILKKRGNASHWVSSATDPCEPYAVDILVVYTPPCEGVDGEEILLADFRYEELAHDAGEGTISCTGKCNITEAVATRVAA